MKAYARGNFFLRQISWRVFDFSKVCLENDLSIKVYDVLLHIIL